MELLSVGRPDVNSDGAISLSRNIGGGGWRNYRIGIDSSFNLCFGDYGASTSGNSWRSTDLTINYNSGNIGIGIANQSQKLFVNGSTYLNGALNVADITSSGNFLINKANPVINFSGTNEGDIVTLFLGTPYINTSAYKTAIIAEGKTGWSRSYLHFCLNNSGTDNSRPAQNAGLNNIRFTIRPDGNFNFYPDPFYINNTNGVAYDMNLNVATNTTSTPALSTFLQARVADGWNAIDTIITLACSGSANNTFYNGSRIILDGSYATNSGNGVYGSRISFQSQGSGGGWGNNAVFGTTTGGGGTIQSHFYFYGTIYYYSLSAITSDIITKKDIVKITDALNKIEKINGIEYKSILSDEKRVGVIAQDVEKVYPELISVDEEGIKGVCYSSLIGLLVEGIKEYVNWAKNNN
jgi:hypothetical protein